MNAPSRDVTLLLQRIQSGDASAIDRLTPLVYDELRRVAAHFLRGERADHTLQPTALVHEAYLRLVRQDSARWDGRAHFVSLAARMMRRILIDHARVRAAGRRGGGDAILVTLTEDVRAADAQTFELLALDLALQGLADIDERAARVVELRFFGGLSNAEIADVLGTSPATVKRDWDFARAWLRDAMDAAAPPEDPPP